MQLLVNNHADRYIFSILVIYPCDLDHVRMKWIWFLRGRRGFGRFVGTNSTKKGRLCTFVDWTDKF